MIDGGLIAGYLAAAAARGGRKILDRAVDASLDRLADAVARKMGPAPEADLARDPGNPSVRGRVATAVARASADDPGFARELAALQQPLDRAGGPTLLLNQVSAGINAQAFGSGNVHVGDYYSSSYTNDYDPADELVSGRGPGRALAVFGLLLALAGFGGWMYLIFTADATTDPFSRELVPGIPLGPVAFAAFLVGGLLYGLGLTMAKAARKRSERRPGPPARRW